MTRVFEMGFLPRDPATLRYNLGGNPKALLVGEHKNGLIAMNLASTVPIKHLQCA